MCPAENSSSPADDAGFTLLEVIVAFAIASLSIAVLFQTFGTGLRSIQRTEQSAQAIMFAESKLAMFEAISLSGRPEIAGHNEEYAWVFESKPHERFKNVNWITVTVSWPADLPSGKRRRVFLTTLQIMKARR